MRKTDVRPSLPALRESAVRVFYTAWGRGRGKLLKAQLAFKGAEGPFQRRTQVRPAL